MTCCVTMSASHADMDQNPDFMYDRSLESEVRTCELGPWLKIEVSVSESFCAFFSQFEAKNDPKRGFGARASKNNTQMAERGRVFSASYKKEEMQPKAWLLLRLRPADFLFSRLPGSRAAELLSGMANI
jgi:hypothetical protein